MSSIWGSSPTDVYVVGHSSQSLGTMYHFDGYTWSTVYLPFGAFDLGAVYGFASNDVWAVGQRIGYNPDPPPNFLDTSLILHYDGSSWHDFRVDEGRALTSVWGSAPTDVWIGGWYGTLFHADGTTVLTDTLPIDIPDSAIAIPLVASISGRSQNETSLLYYAPSLHLFTRFYRFQRANNGWTLADSIIGHTWTSLWMSTGGVLYVTGDDVLRNIGIEWEVILTGFLSTGIHGATENNLFVVGYSGVNDFSGEVYHYNGIDWFHFQQLQFQYVTYRDVFAFENDVFIVGTLSGFPEATIVVHGR